MIFFSSGIYGIITNKIGDDCAQPGNTTEFCVQDFIITYALCNKKESKNLLTGQLVLNFMTILGIAILFEQLRQKTLGVVNQFDILNSSPATYTLRFDGVPSETTNEDIILWLKSLSTEDVEIQVRKVTRTYKISEFVELSKQRSELDRLKSNMTKELEGGSTINRESKTLSFFKPRTSEYSIKKLDLVNEMLKKVKSNNIQKGKIVFVTFETRARNVILSF